ncbi:MAG TPA: kelch repeat-containing protein, partial [Candidatus Binataceae bacterium]|nr:kelch repeat-containing protein [Candidatus Binataceae bacterium]
MTHNRIYFTATLLFDGRVLLAGGSRYARSAAIDTTEYYDPINAAFEPGPEMNRTRAGQTATLLKDGRVLVAGGHQDNSAEIYDPVTESFILTAPMNASRFGHSATLLPDGKVLIAGGWDLSYKPLASAEIFDPATGKFSRTGDMTQARAGQTATLIWMRWPITRPSPTRTPHSSETPTIERSSATAAYGSAGAAPAPFPTTSPAARR